MGFKPIGCFHKAGFKQGSWLDVVWYERPISEYGAVPAKIIPFPALDEKTVERIYTMSCPQTANKK
jgi:phosphinothricin acetyltransferase